MRQRLSPRDTTVLAVLGTTTADGESPSDKAAVVARDSCDRAISCRPAAWATAERFAATVSSARDRSAPKLGSKSASATATLCLDIACVPPGSLDLNVRS